MSIGLQIKAAWYYLLRNFGPVTIFDWYGIKMRVYPFEQTPIKKLITRQNYNYEFEMYRKYAHGVVLDIGANIGIHSVYVSRYASKVYAFEPVLDTFERLKENLTLNKVTNVEAINSAVGSENTTLTMQIFDKANSSWNSFNLPNAHVRPISAQAVPVVTLDSFAEQHNLKEIGFVKIDVEGFELNVLKGASRLLSEKKIAVLSFEVTQMHGKHTEEIFNLLRSHGYKVDNFDPQRTHHNYYAVRNIQ